MPRKKSLNDLVAQAERIKQYPQYQIRNGQVPDRANRANVAFLRYFDNIVNSPAYRRSVDRARAAQQGRGDYWSASNDLKVSQRTYMGLAAG